MSTKKTASGKRGAIQEENAKAILTNEEVETLAAELQAANAMDMLGGTKKRTPKLKPVPRKNAPDNAAEIWKNKTYSIRSGSIEDIDKIAYWTRNRVGELVNMAILEFIDRVKAKGYIEGGFEAIDENGNLKELPEHEIKKREARTARMGRPKKK